MYWEKLSSLVVLLITVEVSIARTLYRRFDISEFLTPSTDGEVDAKATQAKNAAVAQASDFEYDGVHGIAQQIKDAAPVAVNHVTNAAANIGVTSGGVLANIAYQLLNFTKKSISYVGGGTVDKLEQVQNKHKSFMTMTRDAISNTGNYVVEKLEKLSGALDDVAKMSGEEQVVEVAAHRSEHLQEEPKKKKKKKSTSSDGEPRRKGRNSNHRGGQKKKKNDTTNVKNDEKKKKKKKDTKDRKNAKNVKNDQKKKKKRTEEVVDENADVEEASRGWSIF